MPTLRKLHRSGKDCRNPQAKDGAVTLHPYSLDTGNLPVSRLQEEANLKLL
jgi:hypothetical protein